MLLVPSPSRGGPGWGWVSVFIPCADAKRADAKSDKEAQMSEPKASFCASRFCVRSFGDPRQGAAVQGRLSLLTFFGEAKKVSGPPGPVPAGIHGEQQALKHRRKNLLLNLHLMLTNHPLLSPSRHNIVMTELHRITPPPRSSGIEPRLIPVQLR